ncbi:MAG: response regulator [Oscillochloris sp.]|nr:response regulator [Oscillochloris sp.]
MPGSTEALGEALTILVIDDSPHARDTVRAAVALLTAHLPCQPHLVMARSGMEAVQLLRDPPAVDLVVLDVHLPGADVDGRLIGSLIRETLPNAAILPFTGDRSPQTAAALRALGMEEPVFKPVAPEVLAQHLRAALARRGATTPSPIQPFLASQALQLAALLEQGVRRQTVHVAILARNHLARAGLAHVLGDVGPHVPVEVVVSSSQGELIIAAIRAGTVDLLMCAPDALAEGESLRHTHGLPLLIYASVADAAPASAGRPSHRGKSP